MKKKNCLHCEDTEGVRTLLSEGFVWTIDRGKKSLQTFPSSAFTRIKVTIITRHLADSTVTHHHYRIIKGSLTTLLDLKARVQVLSQSLT